MKSYIMGSLALAAMVCFAKNADQGQEAPVDTPAETEQPTIDPAPVVAAAEPVKTKSIVPTGWKSKDDDLKKFIDTQSTGKDGFEMTAFFALCRKNGLDEAKVAHYEGLVAAKAHGIQGRAKMTLRNMLATPARKNGKLVGLDGTEVEIHIAKPALTGAAAKAKEAAAETKTEGPAATA